jgi:formate-dependent nitrite reductase membrane component NrfD
MFLGGMGAGIYTAGFIVGLISDLRWVAVTGMVLGPVLVILGLICLLLEAGAPLQARRLLSGLPTSWMSRGGLTQVLFIIFGLIYAVPGLWFSGWLSSGAGITVGSIGLALALTIATYHGIVLNESKAIPLWSSSVLPLLSLFTALCTGLGLLMLISSAYVGLYGSTEVMNAASLLGIVGIAFIVGQLISVGSLMGAHSSAIYAESIRRLRAPMITNVILLLLALLLLSLSISGVTNSIWSSAISGVLLLAGGFITRYSILKGGYYLPLRVPVPSPF